MPSRGSRQRASAARRAERLARYDALRREANETIAAIMLAHNVYLTHCLSDDTQAPRRALDRYHRTVQDLEALC